MSPPPPLRGLPCVTQSNRLLTHSNVFSEFADTSDVSSNSFSFSAATEFDVRIFTILQMLALRLTPTSHLSRSLQIFQNNGSCFVQF